LLAYAGCTVGDVAYLRICPLDAVRAVRKPPDSAVFIYTKKDQFTKTGSGQDIGLRNKGVFCRGVSSALRSETYSLLAVRRCGKRLLGAISYWKTPNIYQDRLGTAVGNADKERRVSFLLQACGMVGLWHGCTRHRLDEHGC
jgi:hypothetical protein